MNTEKDYTMQIILAAILIQALGYAVGSNKKATFKMVMGGALVTIFLSVLVNVNTRIANGFALMILIGVAGDNLIPLMSKLGLTKSGITAPRSGIKSANKNSDATNTIQENYPIDTSDPTPTTIVVSNESTATPQNSGGTIQKAVNAASSVGNAVESVSNVVTGTSANAGNTGIGAGGKSYVSP